MTKGSAISAGDSSDAGGGARPRLSARAAAAGITLICLIGLVATQWGRARVEADLRADEPPRAADAWRSLAGLPFAAEISPLAMAGGAEAPLSPMDRPMEGPLGTGTENGALIVMLWASWCEFCKGYLHRLPSAGLAPGTQIAAISVDQDRQDAEGAAHSLPPSTEALPIRYYFDAGGQLREQASRGRIPVTLVYGSDRALRGVFVGGGDHRFARIVQKANIEAARRAPRPASEELNL